MSVQSGSKFNGPLKYAAHTIQVGGAVGSKTPFLTDAPLEGIDNLPVLSYGTADDGPRTFGYSWNGCNFPGSYVTTTVNEGLTPTLTAPTTVATVQGGGIVMTTSAAVPAINQYISGTSFKVVANKRMWFNIALSLQTVASEAVLVGLVNSGYAPADLTTLPTAGVFFLKALAATDFTATVRSSSTSTSIATVMAKVGDAPLTDTTSVDLGFRVDLGSDGQLISSQGPISFYVNGKLAGAVASTDANLPTVALAYYIGCNTTGGAKSMTVTQSCMLCEI